MLTFSGYISAASTNANKYIKQGLKGSHLICGHFYPSMATNHPFFLPRATFYQQWIYLLSLLALFGRSRWPVRTKKTSTLPLLFQPRPSPSSLSSLSLSPNQQATRQPTNTTKVSNQNGKVKAETSRFYFLSIPIQLQFQCQFQPPNQRPSQSAQPL